jgi:ATP-dependent Clp protease ATP-binding subunit ClpC
VFERFTETARQVIVLAQEEARGLGHDFIGTEHFLLGLQREPGIAREALESLEVRYDGVHAQVARIVGRGNVPIGQIPFTPRSKKVLELSVQEAESLEHDQAAPEHILLAIAREGEGVASEILRDLGADAEAIRAAVAGAS